MCSSCLIQAVNYVAPHVGAGFLICMCLCLFVCSFVYVYMFVCLRVCVCVCVCVCVHWLPTLYMCTVLECLVLRVPCAVQLL